jgi:hypothetical protein
MVKMTKKIILTQGQVAIVDDEDYEYLNQWKWYAKYNKNIKNYYAARAEYLGRINGKYNQKTIFMHRVIMNPPKGKVVDHVNHDTLDNRRSNLRIVYRRQNDQNKKNKKTSNYPGVSWHKATKKWTAQIVINKKKKYLGIFADEREAAKAYENACREQGQELVCKT